MAKKPKPQKNVLMVSVRIDSVSPSHVTLSIFEGLAYDDHEPGTLHTLTRGNSGQFTIDRDAAPEFIARLRPVKISRASTDYEVITENYHPTQIEQWLTLTLDQWRD